MSTSDERGSAAHTFLGFGFAAIVVITLIYLIISSLVSCVGDEVVAFRKEIYQSKYVPKKIPVTYYMGHVRVRFNQYMTSAPSVYLEEDETLYMQAAEPKYENLRWFFKIKGLYSEKVRYCGVTPDNMGQLKFFEEDNSHHIWITAPCILEGETATLAIWIEDYKGASSMQYADCRPEPWDICR